MELVKLSSDEFTTFMNNQTNASIYQTEEYARFMEENDYDYDFIGLKDRFNNIRVASLIGFKKINNSDYYGYAPNGFYIDYNDIELLNDFVKALRNYYKKQNIIFIKINPNIVVGKLNKKTLNFVYNDNLKIKDNLQKCKFQELKNNIYFESLISKYTPLVNLKSFAYNKLSKNIRNKIRKSYKKGLAIEKTDYQNLKYFYPLVKNKNKFDYNYYDNLFRSFDNSHKIDLFLVSINFEEYLINMKDEYQKELKNNLELIEKVRKAPNDKNLNRKILSDKDLQNIKKNIIEATDGLAKQSKKYIAGAIVIKNKDKESIFESGYDIKYKDCNGNYFLNYKLMEYYKYNYTYLDMNGFSGDLNKSNPYYGLNEFKLGFNADIYENIGEYDLIVNKGLYKKYASTGKLAKLFTK